MTQQEYARHVLSAGEDESDDGFQSDSSNKFDDMNTSITDSSSSSESSIFSYNNADFDLSISESDSDFENTLQTSTILPKLLHWKYSNNISDASFLRLLAVLGKSLPEISIYKARQFLDKNSVRSFKVNSVRFTTLPLSIAFNSS